MVRGALPYIRRCTFCEQGLLRFLRCRKCHAFVACCDECELLWGDIAAAHHDPQLPSTGAFPACPHCGDNPAQWDQPTQRQLHTTKLEPYIGGKSK